jgi:trk system potassium uptake protein TrkH
MKVTTRILYLIYLGMTAIEILILCFGPLTDYNAMVEAFGEPMATAYHNDKIFHAFLTGFGCAGTGGFGFIPNSMEYFTPFAQYVMAIFLIFFGINFSLYYLLLIGKLKEIFKSEELRSYLLIVVLAVGLIFFSLIGRFEAFPQEYTTEEAFRHSLFQVASLISTAGFSTTDFAVWPMISRMTLLIVMFTGGMAGSTAGGIKVSRIIIAVKGAVVNVRKLINPRYVPKSKFEGKPLEERTTNDVFAFFTLYFFFLIGVVFVLSFDPINGQAVKIVSDAGEYVVEHGFFSNFSATVACLSNVGPALEALGPYSSYVGYSCFSKIILTFTMMIGRLEILPVLILFNPKTWSKV